MNEARQIQLFNFSLAEQKVSKNTVSLQGMVTVPRLVMWESQDEDVQASTFRAFTVS